MILDIVMHANQYFKTERVAPVVERVGVWISWLPRSVLLMAVGIGYLFLLSINVQVVAEESARCKYSVRDVAFVNVHGKSWQLRLVKPQGVAPEIFEKWNLALRSQLADSNVGYTWYDSDSDIGKQIQLANPNATQAPLMDLVRLSDVDSSISVSSPIRLEDRLKSLIHSPARNEIFSELVDALCVFVLVQSGDESQDAVAEAAVNAAVKRVNDQMWTLEKPTDFGPAIIIVPQSRRSEERWLLSSLGITDEQRPAVAVLYGQGRLLGDVLFGEEIAVDPIVTRASICGQDCECSLDRNWLYGVQVLHQWDKTLERRAEASLDFDPNSVFVIAEVAQILQKNAGQNNQAPPVILGGGLVIHELDDLEAGENLEADVSSTDAAVASSTDDTEENQPVELSDALSVNRPESAITVPWTILVLFSGIVLLIVFFIVAKS